MMYALDPAVHGPVFETIKALIPPPRVHPLGCHRRRVPDKVCFAGILLRLVTGASWETIEYSLGYTVSDTTLRARHKEWVNAGIYEQLAPCGGETAGHSIKHPGRLSWKWCLAVDNDGIPFAWNIAPGNRNDYAMFFPLLDQLRDRNLTHRIGTLHADRGFNYTSTPPLVAAYGITNFAAPTRNNRTQGTKPLVGLGHRWIVESTNSWLRNYGQLRRSTERTTTNRHAALCLAITLFITHRLTNHETSPIR